LTRFNMYCMITYMVKPLGFEWNRYNKDKNWIKHKIDYKECEEVFFNKPLKIVNDPRHSLEEKRFVAYGITNQSKKLTIVFTKRGEKIRVISARNQSRKERSKYEE